MDISDGLFCDTNKLLDINGYEIEIINPISSEIGQSGEEYEMLVGFSPNKLKSIEAIAKETKTPLNIFAKVVQKGELFGCVDHHFS